MPFVMKSIAHDRRKPLVDRVRSHKADVAGKLVATQELVGMQPFQQGCTRQRSPAR